MKTSATNSLFNLYSTERIFKDETLMSYYFQPNKKIKKSYEPVDIDGIRFRKNIETGEISTYTKELVFKSKNASLRRTKIIINSLLKMNDFYWFWTLTFDKSRVERTSDKAVLECYEKFVNNITKQYPTFKYMTFPERHKKDGSLHYHLLVAGLSPEQMGLVNSGKVCCHWVSNGYCSREYFNKTKSNHKLKETDGETIFNVTKFAYGFTTCSRIVSRERCKSYVKKYVEKDLGQSDANLKRFYHSRNLKMPDIVKRLVGSDYEYPTSIDKDSFVKNSPYLKNCSGIPTKSEYNVLQFSINNKIKKFIDLGFEPVNDEEEKNAISKAFEEQIKFNELEDELFE